MLDSTTATYTSIALGVIGVIIVLLAAFRPPRRKGPKPSHGPSIALSCSVCQRDMVFSPGDLQPLTPAELGLTVRARPEMRGKRLASYSCPYCESVHCFEVDGKKTEWMGANFYTPQLGGANCLECLKPVKAPPWPEGQYEGAINQAPNIPPNTGMKCSRCGAVVCFECANGVTRGSVKGPVYKCPRCSRVSIDRFFYP